MYDYNFPEQLRQDRLTLLLLSLVIPTDSSILQKIYKKKRELEIYDYKDSQNWSIMADDGRCALYKVSLQIRALYPGFIMYGIPYLWGKPNIYTHPLTEIKGLMPKSVSVINHLFTYWVIDTNQDRIKNVCEEKLTQFSVITANPVMHCKTFSETLSKFRNIAEIIDRYGSFGVGDEDIYTTINELNQDLGICVDKYGGINC